MRNYLMTTVVLIAAPPLVAENIAAPVALPDAPALSADTSEPLPREALMRVETLANYSEPDWVSKLVAAGKLPSVAERLPKAPIVMDMTSTPHGVGRYGGVLRHVTGGRPNGWNWAAGQTQGWGGVNMTHQECLTNTGALWALEEGQSEPLPNLATNWEWSADGMQLTMHLLEGAKWSDGDPFDAEDVLFFWEDNVLDPRVPSRATIGAFGEGTTLEQVNAHTIRWTFANPHERTQLLRMAYPTMCPGPAHILKPLHPKYNDDATYESYISALAPSTLPWVTMGPWAAVDYAPDQFIIARRNPYYFKVDQQGNQLPYLDEVQWRLSTVQDRDVQTLAGNADYTNMQDPSLYLEGVKAARAEDSPVNVYWGPRVFHWRIDLNLSTSCGADDPEALAYREKFREFEVRRAFSHAMDRRAMGQALIRGPFTAQYPGGLHPDSGSFDLDRAVFYPFDPASATALLEQAGLEDIDGDGFVDWTDGPLKGQTFSPRLHFMATRTTDAALGEASVAMLREAGIRVVSSPLQDYVNGVVDSCDWELVLQRGDRAFQVPLANINSIAPVGYASPPWHKGTSTKPQKLLPFEERMAEIAAELKTEADPAQQRALFNEYEQLFTANVYSVGLVTAAGALAINKRIRNVVPGTPVLSYQWSELTTMRERFWIDEADIAAATELRPGTLPGIQ
ncbi:ABC transporter substrate-binding protein [Halovulum sp. GXIMD14794]